MKIVKIDADRNRKELETGIRDENVAVRKIVALANEYAKKLPNNPTVTPSGAKEISVYIGIYRMMTFSIEYTE